MLAAFIAAASAPPPPQCNPTAASCEFTLVISTRLTNWEAGNSNRVFSKNGTLVYASGGAAGKRFRSPSTH